MCTPTIRISSRYSPPDPPVSSSASPMSIPRAREVAPPPLPPPMYLPEISAGSDPGWQWGNDPNGSDFGRPASIKPGSSLLGSFEKRMQKEHDNMSHYSFNEARRGSSLSTITAGREQDMVDDTAAHNEDDVRPNSNALHGAKQLERRAHEESSQSYDKQLLSRIGGPNTPSRGSLSHSAGNPLDNSQLAPSDAGRQSLSLRPLSMSERRHGSVDSPSSMRWPASGAISPGFTGFWADQGPSENSRIGAMHRSSLASEDLPSHRGSYDHSMFINDDFGVEDGQMSSLNIHDRGSGSPKAGSKRRASSPPREREDRSSISSAPGHGEVYQRRSLHQLPNRGSPISRFHPNHSSISSASSVGARHGSLGSSLGLSSVPSSATSYASGRISPGALSPAVESDARLGAPYGASKALNPTSPIAHHQRTLSESTQGGGTQSSTESATHSRHGSLSQMQGVYMCECCPKKPKKFDTEDELRMHESEKQYACNYCSNRFKNKNEAERHQNSLHLRRHSWACSALTGIEAAYHPSANGTDACGFCGQEFSNPPQWDIRAEHLNHVHKFGECNQAKKFYRADHFRQHLKHSHQGTSGKWTNMLENACMKDEPLPNRVDGIASTAVARSQAPPALMVTTSGLAPNLKAPNRLDETPHDS